MQNILNVVLNVVIANSYIEHSARKRNLSDPRNVLVGMAKYYNMHN